MANDLRADLGAFWRRDVPDGRPALPLAALPASLRDWIDAVALSYQVPAELPAAAALGAIAAAVGGRARVRVTPDWGEELALYLAVVLPSGERKSPVLAAAKAPIEAAELAMVEASRERVEQAQSAHRILTARVKAAEGRAAGAKDTAERVVAEEEARTLAGELARSAPPVLPRLLADDSTPEALVSLLVEQGGAIAVLSAEGGILDTLAGRYSDGVANLDAVLKAHGGEQVRVDRRGRPPEYVGRPVLTLALAVQPVVIESARANASMAGRGLLARFLYLLPETALGERKLDPPPVPEAVSGAYTARLAALLDARPEPIGEGGPRELTLSPEAGALLRTLRAEVEGRLAPSGGDLFPISGWAGKLVGAVVRIAALLHLYEDGPSAPPVIGEGPMRAAVGWAQPLAAHALAALGGAEDAGAAVGRRRPGSRGPAPERRGELAGRALAELGRTSGPLMLADVARTVGVDPKDQTLRAALAELVEAGQVSRDGNLYARRARETPHHATPITPRMDSGVWSSAEGVEFPDAVPPRPRDPAPDRPPEWTAAEARVALAEPDDDPGWLAPGPALAGVVAPEWSADVLRAELALAAEREGS